MLQLDLDELSEPPSLVAEAYRDFTSYNIAIYSRGELFFHQLRYIVGDETMHRILRTFYERWKFHHVDEAAFRAVAEEVSHQDLSALFAQWLHGTDLYDYAVGRVKTRRIAVDQGRHAGLGDACGGQAQGAGTDPGGGRGDRAGRHGPRPHRRARGSGVGRDRDPHPAARGAGRSPGAHARLEHARTTGSSSASGCRSSSRRCPGARSTFIRYFSTRSRRDRLTVGFQPTVWYNDAGGVTLGIRQRDDYFGRFQQNSGVLSWSTGWGVRRRRERPGLLLPDPESDRFSALRVCPRRWTCSTSRDGTALSAKVERTRRAHLTFGPT